MKFEDLGLCGSVLKAVTAEGYTTPTPIQQQAVPHVLAGRDVLGCAQTGTGKTAAFALPILDRLTTGPRPKSRSPIRVLVLSPTRELTVQIYESFRTYGKYTGLKYTSIFGGVGQNPQVRALRAGVDVLVATPGRLLDLMGQGCVDLRHIEVFVLDEADRMLDMGFMPDVRRIVEKIPAKRQTLFFSATMPRDIRQLADTILTNPVQVQVEAVSSPIALVKQSLYHVEKRNKPVLLAHLLRNTAIGRAIVFTRTKHGADRVVLQLRREGLMAEAIHGNKSQTARQRALAKFKSNNPPVLVATDIAARGLDIEEVSHVFNFELPNIPETYIHRIGRTGRAGATGEAIAFCSSDERSELKDIEKLMNRRIEVRDDHPTYPARPANADGPAEERSRPPRSMQMAKVGYRAAGPNAGRPAGSGGSNRPGGNRSGSGNRSGGGSRGGRPGSNPRHHSAEVAGVKKMSSTRRRRRPPAAPTGSAS